MYTVPSAPPLNVGTVAVNSTSIEVTWAPPAVADRNGVITAYLVQLVEVPTGELLNFTQTMDRLEIVITALHPHYDYECSVAASTSVGDGPYSQPITETTLQDGRPLMSVL